MCKKHNADVSHVEQLSQLRINKTNTIVKIIGELCDFFFRKICSKQTTPNSPVEADLQFPGCPTLATCCFSLRVEAKQPQPFVEEHPLNFATPAKEDDKRSGGTTYENFCMLHINTRSSMITNLKARVNPTLRETLWRSCRDLSTDRNAIIANGDTVRNKRKNNKRSTFSTVLLYTRGQIQAGEMIRNPPKYRRTLRMAAAAYSPLFLCLKVATQDKPLGYSGLRKTPPRTYAPWISRRTQQRQNKTRRR